MKIFPSRSVLVLFCLVVLSGSVNCGGGGGGGTDSVSPGDTTPPTAPMNVAATLSAPTSIALSWNASTDDSGVAGYKIYLNGSYLENAAGLTKTYSGLASTTEYCYSVSAFDAAGNESPHSDAPCRTTGDGSPPSVPAGLTVSASVPGQLDLTWSPSSDNVGVTGYNVYRSGALITTVTGTGTVDSGRSPATEYCYQVSATDGDGNESGLSAAACGTTLWRVETITCLSPGYYLGPVAIALDGQNEAHVAFSGQNASLNYATNSSGTWLSTLVQQGTTEGVSDVGIAVDRNGRAHISYYSFVDFLTPTKDLKYATNAPDGTWSSTAIDAAGDVGLASAIALDSGNKAHISYYDATNQSIKYATNAAGGWAVTTIDNGGPFGKIAVAPNDEINLIYGSAVFPYPLTYALISGTTTTSHITSSLAGGLIAFDPGGTVYVAYRTGYVMQYVSWVNGAWVGGSTGIDSIADTMIIDGDGTIHFYGASNYFPNQSQDGVFAVLYYTNASGTWTETISVVDAEPDVPVHALVVDGSTAVHVVYQGGSNCLKYATNR